MASTTTTIRVSEEEKAEWESLARFEGVRLSTLMKEKMREAYEDWHDLRVVKREHKRYLKHPEEFRPITELWAEMFDE